MAVTKEDITELYIAYYDRAPDNAGLEFWMASGFTIEQMAGNFAQQAETQAKYPDTLSTTEYVNTIYKNVFNRDADATGLAYWVDALDSGKISKGDMIIAVVNGAQGDDQVILDNKVVVGIAYADAGLDDYDDAVSIMDRITADSHTVVSAIDQIDALANVGDGVIFTTDRDTLVGTSADETFKGTVSGTDADNKDTYQGFDGLHGGEGTDTLEITSSVTTAAGRTIGAAKVSAVEILKVIQNAYVDVVVDPSNFDSNLTKIVAQSGGTSSGDIVVGTGVVGGGSSLKKIVDVELGMSNHQSLVLNYTDTVVSNGYNEMKVTLTNGVPQRLEVKSETTNNAIETYTVDTQDTAQSLTIVDGANQTIKVEGNGTLTLTSATAKTIDASAATGHLIFTPVVAVSDIIGSTGSDTISGIAGARIEGGGGADTLTIVGGDETISYVDKGDSIKGKEDKLVKFVSTGNHINVSKAVNASHGYETDTAPTSFLAAANGSMAEGDAYVTGGVSGVTHIYVDTTTLASQVAYVDLNQDNKFQATLDLVIKVDSTVALVAADFIV